MPTLNTVWLPTPQSDEDLEELVLDYFSQVWRGAQRNGRPGQRQHGVDVFGQLDSGGWAGAQAKARQPGRELTLDEVQHEVELAKAFRPSLRQFIVVTSALQDASLQEAARRITEEHAIAGLFGVDIWGWQALTSRLAVFPDILRRNYPQLFDAGVAALRSERSAPCIIDIGSVDLPSDGVQFGTVRFSITNASGDFLKITSIRLDVVACSPLDDVQFPRHAGPIYEHFLYARVGPQTEVCELIHQHYELRPGHTDGFLLKVDGEEGNGYTIRLLVTWNVLGQARNDCASPPFLVQFPLRTPAGLLRLARSRQGASHG